MLNKVPTAVLYDNGHSVREWGGRALEALDSPNGYVARLFKLYIDPEYTTPEPVRLPAGEARRFFKDYLSCLYEHFFQYFEQSFPRARHSKFEYHFSMPTTWTDPALTTELERIIKAAGFGRDPSKQMVLLSSTEAEAAAVHASKEGYSKGDVVLVTDIGGGTTDVSA